MKGYWSLWVSHATIDSSEALVDRAVLVDVGAIAMGQIVPAA